MGPAKLSRRGVLASTGLICAAPALAQGFGVRLLSLPTRLYKTPDAGHERTESWVFWVFVESDAPRGLKATGLQVELSAAGQPIRSMRYGPRGVAALTITPPLRPRRLDGSAAPTPVYWPQAVRVRCTEPLAAAVDALSVELDLSEGKQTIRCRVAMPVETYRQRTALIYPFQGRGVVTQAGVTNGGHRNRSGQFALDVVGLDDSYGVNLPGQGRHSADYHGWGRPILAPADGVVVSARSDRPDQPDPEVSDPRFYAPEHPDGGDPGNHLVIDHGQAEFSMLAHFQAGSMLVKAGDRVRQGQPIGKLGSSGDTNTPHLHYQLQSGPDWEWADGLPCRFSNVTEAMLVRGSFFNAA